MAEKPAVTMKDTKATIMAALEDSQKRLEQLESQRFSPGDVKAQKADQEAIAHVDEMDWDLDMVFGQMRKHMDSNLRTMQENLETEKEELDKVRRAKAAEVAELKELYGISKEANTFAALVEAQKMRKEQFEDDLKKKKEEVDAYVDEKKANMREELASWNRESERREQEWQYKFDRECKTKWDEFNDKLEVAKKTWNSTVEAEEKTLNERKEAVAKQEEELTKLKSEVEAFPARLEEAREEARKKAQQSYAFEVNALKRNHEADMKVLQHETQSLAKARDDLVEKVKDLENKLEAAYEKIQGVASKALESQGNARTTEEIQRAVASTTAGKNR